ncbi:MAG: Ig-like domain-containing protein [Flavobacteriaceae bacterium]
MRLPKSPLFAVLLLSFYGLYSQGSVSGELRKWHTVTILFDGPNTGENSATNPFLDYRLNVTFNGPNGSSFVVPGYYAADGDAANSGASSGNKWAVKFTPNQTGQWTYTASFRTGNNVAISLDANAGNATSFNGASGNFSISASNKSGADNRAKGRLNYIGQRYLQYEETGNYFLKSGADSPENLLGYGEFDNTVNSKDWGPHVQDWNTGDPSWKNGKGKGLIGAINYLAQEGMNAFSFLTMNVIGDGKDVWPWVATNHSDLDGNSGADANNRTRYDVSKLAQWEILFSHADSKGMYLHFKTQETENLDLLDGNQLGTQRKLYYRELVARFGHHLALNWNLGEEFDIYNASLINSYADYIRAVDPYDHHIVIHSYPNRQDNLYNPLLGNSGKITGPSLQIQIDNIHEDVKRWITASANSGKHWVVSNDEQGNHQRGVTADDNYGGDKGIQDDNRAEVRHKALWGTLMAGGTGVEYYFGYQTGETDLTAQDWRSRDSKWRDAKIALDFFNQHLPFWTMQSSDQLTSANNDYCFSKSGDVYAIYLPGGGSTNINLSGVSGDFSVAWFNPRNGGNLQNGSTQQISGGGNRSVGNPPNSASQDWVVLIKQIEGGSGGNSGGNTNCEADYQSQNGLVIIEAEDLNTSAGWTTNSSASGFTGNGYLEWQGGDSFNTPGNGLISTSIEINEPGTYLFQWRNKVGHGTSITESNDTWLRFPDASDFYGEKAGGHIVYPKGSGKSPNPAGAGSNGWFKVYVNSLDWVWAANTSDHDPHKIYVTFDTAGIYTMEISGRSDHHLIDRIVLTSDFNAGTNLSLQQTPCEGTGNPTVEVTGISLSQTEVSLFEGETFTLSSTVLPSNATNKTVFWSSSDSSVATVDGNGRITAVSEGNAIITATTEDGDHKATANVMVIKEAEPDPDPEPEPEPEPDFECNADFVAKNNIVVIEAEHLNVSSGWSHKSDVEGFSGGGYIEWEGEDQFTSPGEGLITTTIDIKEAGIYTFQWRNKVGIGESSTESNDSWLRFPDAAEFYGKKSSGTIIYPKGGEKNPWPNGAGSDGWFKVYLNTGLDWTWSTNTSDNDPHEIYVRFDSPGIYTMEISGRSKGHLLDRIVLSKDGTDATDLNIEETQCDASKNAGPRLIMENSSAVEGENIEFAINLSKMSSETIVLDITFTNETADLSDYFPDIETVTFAPGETKKILSIPTHNDNNREEDETFVVGVSEVKSGELQDFSDTAVLTIIDEDAPLSIFPNPARANNTIQLDGLQPGAYRLGIFSMSGELIQGETIAVHGTSYELQLSSMAGGFYVVRVAGIQKSFSGKLIVQ